MTLVWTLFYSCWVIVLRKACKMTLVGTFFFLRKALVGSLFYAKQGMYTRRDSCWDIVLFFFTQGM